MLQERFHRKVESLLSFADIRINGNRPWDLKVHNNRFYTRLLTSGSLGLGESYMDKWWDCEDLDELFYKVFRTGISEHVNPVQDIFYLVHSRCINLQSSARAFQVGRRHYDIGNDLYEKMLDKRMIYSCGYWKEALSLDEAQEAKLDLVCRKLDIQKGMRVLDIGCGWGGTAKYIAEKYDVDVVGVTVSREQALYAREKCNGLPVDIRLQDYRCLDESFDRILSIGMFEHVGYKNYSRFMKCVRKNLKDDGLFLLHTIGGSRSVTKTDPWIDRYIFPNSMLPSQKQIRKAADGLFILEDWHNFGVDYDRTLMAWYKNFSDNLSDLKEKYGERFCRMWRYYLLICAGSFRARKNHVWQIIFSPKGVPGGYRCCR